MKQKQFPLREIAQVIFKNAQILDITGPNEVFAQVNESFAKSDIYDGEEKSGYFNF